MPNINSYKNLIKNIAVAEAAGINVSVYETELPQLEEAPLEDREKEEIKADIKAGRLNLK